MPRRYPPYPYTETHPSDLSDADIVTQAEAFAKTHGYQTGHSLDPICHKLDIDIEYSTDPNDILLDVPVEGRTMIWLAKHGRKRQDRINVARALGCWTLMVDATQRTRPDHGVQVLYQPTNPVVARQALRFAFALLMPEAAFRAAWYEGRASLAADIFDVPTQSTYDRAADLLLPGSDDDGHAAA